jgi:GNAT superfamily N-acetyltransferase
VSFLEDVEFGGQGLRYRRKHLLRALERLDDSVFLSLREDGVIRAGYALMDSPAKLDGQPLAAVYRGLLAVDPTRRRRGLGRHLVETALAGIEARSADQPFLSFGLIETENSASRRLLESLGATEVGNLQSRLVYRQWPRRSSRFVQLDTSLAGAYERRLSAQRGDRGLTLRASARYPAYGLVDGGELLAAARVGVTTLDLGAGGPLARFLQRNAYGRFRVLGKRYNRRAFRYLTIHDPLVSDETDAWQAFLEGMLAHHDSHMALFTLDPRSDVAARLGAAGLFGRFAKTTQQDLVLVASGWNLVDGWAERIRSAPVTGGPVF